MNIALILSGGVGKRFAAGLPKQYNLVNGRPVIDYVIKACQNATLVDKIVVVCNPGCEKYSKLLTEGNIDIVNGGKERYDSLNNGLEFIKENYNCKNICIFDAAAPLVYSELVDDYFRKLDEYDCVITCKKLVGELGNYNYDIFVRDEFYFSQSPESFRFEFLAEHFRPDFYSSELVYQLPKSINRYLNFNFQENIKITYDYDLILVEALMNYYKNRYIYP